MSYYISPKDIICDLLRHRLTDPRRRCERTYSEFFTGDGATSEFDLTPPVSDHSVSAITDVTLDGTSLTKWKDYYFEKDDEKIIFTSTYGDPAGDLIVHFKHGETNWIYSDKPNKRLKSSSFPRINTLMVPGGGKRLGNYKAPINYNLAIQIDIWVKQKAENQIFNVVTPKGDDNTRSFAGEELCEYLGYEILDVFREYEDDLHPCLFAYVLTSVPRDLPFNEDYNCFHKTVEVGIQGVNIGFID